MANPYFTASPLTVYDGDIAKASDLNNLSVAVETAFDLGDQILQTIVSDTTTILEDASADVALTHADVLLTNADVVLTHADVVLTHADVVLTNASAAASEISRLASGVSAGESEAAKIISVAQADTATAQAVIATDKAAEAAASAASITPVPDQVHAAADKTTPVDADEFPLVDSEATFGLKKYSWANIKTALLAAWKDATGGLVGLTLFKINFSNAANTFISFLTNTNTASRTYTFQDRDGTIADDTDLALKVSTSAIGVATGNVPLVNQAETSVASASSITLATTLNQLLTGTTPVSTINSVAGRTNRIRVETGTFDLTHSAGLNCLQTGATITTRPGDTFDWFALTSTTGIVMNYIRADGTALKSDSYVLIRDEKTVGTDGGDFISGAWRQRVLNTEVNDADGLATLSLNIITLAAGTYRFLASAPAFSINTHKCRLVNLTDTIYYYGTVARADANYAGTDRSSVSGRFTISAPKTFELRHYCATTKSGNGLGVSMNIETEVYAQVEFWREG